MWLLVILSVLVAAVLLLSVALVVMAAAWQGKYNDVMRSLDWVEKRVKTTAVMPREGSSREKSRDRLADLERSNAHLWRLVESLSYRVRHREQVQDVIEQIKLATSRSDKDTQSGEQTKDEERDPDRVDLPPG